METRKEIERDRAVDVIYFALERVSELEAWKDSPTPTEEEMEWLASEYIKGLVFEEEDK